MAWKIDRNERFSNMLDYVISKRRNSATGALDGEIWDEYFKELKDRFMLRICNEPDDSQMSKLFMSNLVGEYPYRNTYLYPSGKNMRQLCVYGRLGILLKIFSDGSEYHTPNLTLFRHYVDVDDVIELYETYIDTFDYEVPNLDHALKIIYLLKIHFSDIIIVDSDVVCKKKDDIRVFSVWFNFYDYKIDDFIQKRMLMMSIKNFGIFELRSDVFPEIKERRMLAKKPEEYIERFQETRRFRVTQPKQERIGDYVTIPLYECIADVIIELLTKENKTWALCGAKKINTNDII